MTKVIFGLFAHPDDEAFGVAATLIKEVQSGTRVYLICATAGEAGTNPDEHENLGAVRLEEWQRSAALIGATDTLHLGYRDGTLCNDDFLPIAGQLEDYIRSKVAANNSPIELMSFESNGISGHLDHILMSRVSQYLYLKLRDELPMRLRLACITRDRAPTPNIHWLYMEAGHPSEEIDEIVDARDIFPLHREVMEAHHSQRDDYENYHRPRGDEASINYFIVRE